MTGCFLEPNRQREHQPQIGLIMCADKELELTLTSPGWESSLGRLLSEEGLVSES